MNYAAIKYESINDLLEKAKEQPARSNNRRFFQSHLIRAIQNSDLLRSPQECSCAAYNEAVYETLRDVCQQLDSYDPLTGTTVRDWVQNILLKAISRHKAD